MKKPSGASVDCYVLADMLNQWAYKCTAINGLVLGFGSHARQVQHRQPGTIQPCDLVQQQSINRME